MSNKTIIFCSVVSVSIFCLAVISMTYAGVPPGRQPPSKPLDLGYVPGELLVRFAAKADGMQLSAAERNQILSSLGAATVIGNYKIVPGLSHVKLPAGVTVEQAMAQLNKTEGIMYAQPNHYLMLCSGQKFPNDPLFYALWGMHNTGQYMCGGPGGTVDADIDAPEAWDIKTDASDIIVAVIDSGVDYEHEDLAANMWTNPVEEIGDKNGDGRPGVADVDDDGDGLVDEDSEGRSWWEDGWTNDLIDDDDENGYNDDIYGYDFCTIGEKERDSDPMDDDPLGGHGTLMAGTIGAVGDNGVGVVGVCWNSWIVSWRQEDSYVEK